MAMVLVVIWEACEYESKLEQCDRLIDVASERSPTEIRIKSLNWIVIKLRNKLDIVVDQMTGNVDVMVILETKLHDSFRESQFKVPGHSSPFRLDRGQNGGGIMVFVRDDITAKLYLSRIKNYWSSLYRTKLTEKEVAS